MRNLGSVVVPTKDHHINYVPERPIFVLSSQSTKFNRNYDGHIELYFQGSLQKQAENGLQLRSSKNGRTAVLHYGLKLK